MSTYIKLSDVQKILDRAKYCQVISDGYTIRSPAIGIDVINISAIQAINSLPSISFEEMIKEKLKMCKAQASDSERHFGGMVVCEQLLNKLPK